ncbi:hypothetical protein [Sphingobacterium siyangense]|uniref:hypothetical protein n=1 Tax=Sphingobacterium siyangense TaxID=459529 RepID=UPI0028AE884C|nr:hypothetical protein [Sphingobacterium siyangense]
MNKYTISVFGSPVFCLLMISIFVVISCSVLQGKKQLEEKSTKIYSQYEQQNLQFHQKQQDRLSSYWYFSTDSTFWFHPDSGLWAKSGKIFAHLSNIKSAEENLQLRQANSEAASVSDSRVKRENKVLSAEFFTIGVVSLAALGYWIWWRRRKKAMIKV